MKELMLNEIEIIAGGAKCWCINVKYAGIELKVFSDDGLGYRYYHPPSGKWSHYYDALGMKKDSLVPVVWTGDLTRDQCKNKCCNEIGSLNWAWGLGPQQGRC